MILDIIKHDIAVYVSHTNIDVVGTVLMTGSASFLRLRRQVILVGRGQITVLAA